ncbi:MAG TPA: NlpC/P60 family protein [Candidatus Xenobia bacterium]
MSSVLSRIQQIESQFAPPAPPPAPGFDAALNQELQAQVQGGPNALPPGVTAFNPAMLQNLGMAVPAGPVSGSKIEAAAASMNGRQYWSNACAHAVNDVLSNLGINVTPQTNGNPNWVPNYANLGQKVDNVAAMQPGDLVIYNNYLGQGGYDHIGIYAGNGEAWNVSTAAGHKWVKSPIGNRFQEGRRISG